MGKCPSDVQEKSEHFNRHFNKHFNMSKADIRTACRKRWGKEWYEVHPVIKKARMTWAAGGDPEGRLVIVHEGLDTYTA